MADKLVDFYARLARTSLRLRSREAIQRAGEASGGGQQGAEGPAGPPGPEGAVGPAPEHQWIDTSLQFQEPSGEWGPLVNLKGDPGETRVVHVSTGGGGGTTIVAANSYFPGGW